MDPRVVSQIMLARFPEFVQLCLSEAMLGGGIPMPGMPPAVEPPEHIAYQRALEQASNIFAKELMQEQPTNGEPLCLTFADGSSIDVEGRKFLKRHFARNFHLHFQRRIFAHFATRGLTVVNAVVSPDGGQIVFTFPPA
jgi:hypothetical protein